MYNDADGSDSPSQVQPPRTPRTAVRSPRHDVADRPFLVIWEATQACPLACRHCRAEARPYRHEGELDTDEAMLLMRQVADFGRPAPLFVITGGDPFQRPDLYALVRHGTELGLAVSVSPSGTPTLTRDALARLRDAGARAISLSLDAGCAPRHDGFRGVAGVYRWTIEAWTAALDLGLKVQINTTVTRDTVNELPEIAGLVRQHHAQLWSVFLLVPTGRGRDLRALNPAETEDVLNVLYDLGQSLPVKTTEGHHFRRVCVQRAIIERRGVSAVETLGLGPLYGRLRSRLAAMGLVARLPAKCPSERDDLRPAGSVAKLPAKRPGERDDLRPAGSAERPVRTRRPPMRVSAASGFVFVSHLGDVHPTGFLPLGAGNVRQRSLPEIYRESELFTGLRDVARLGGRCGRCEFREICGGSRARAYAVSGDPFAEDPACSYQPSSFPFPDDIAEMLTAAGYG